ncbi:MAG: hypothetical protein P9M15_08345 [Candidatus Electryoneaceae bacterium]|nr:hypothetical protein [Candidatus Electryoneaceae bacterium]
MKVQLKAGNRITFPEDVVRAMNLTVDDEFFVVIRNGHVELVLVSSIPDDERYLYTPYWQEAFGEAEKEIAEGRLEHADSVEEMFHKLEEE